MNKMVRKSHHQKVKDKKRWRNENKDLKQLRNELLVERRAIELFGLTYNPKRDVYCPDYKLNKEY